MPRTSARLAAGRTSITSPERPLSRPVMTTTLSPLRIFAAITAPPARARRSSCGYRPRAVRAAPARCSCGFSPTSSEHLRRERNDLHVVLGAQFARNRSEDARADRLHLRIDQHRRVVVEADHRTVGALDV